LALLIGARFATGPFHIVLNVARLMLMKDR